MVFFVNIITFAAISVVFLTKNDYIAGKNTIHIRRQNGWICKYIAIDYDGVKISLTPWKYKLWKGSRYVMLLMVLYKIIPRFRLDSLDR